MAYYQLASFQPCDSLGYRVKRLHKAAHALIEERFRDLDLSFSQWVSLAVIRSGSVDTSAGLASHLGHDSGATTRLVDGLEARGFIQRDRDTNDRRVVRLSLTPEGRAACDALTPRVMDFWNEVLEEFPAAEIDRFLATLRRLDDRLETMAGAREAGE